MRAAINSAGWNGYAGFKGGKADWKDFVREAAQAGYAGVELGGTRDKLGEPADCRRFVEGEGLAIASFAANVTYNPWKPNTEAYRASLQYAAELGVSTIMTCGGFIPNPRRNTYAFDYDMFAGNLGRAMAYAGRLGLTIAFHPHRGSVVETIRETREMVKRLPELKLCVDIAHLAACGEDAVAFIRAFGRRIIATHIKDYAWKRDGFMELGRGDGCLDVAACVRALRAARYDGWLTVELDRKFTEKDSTPVESARISRRYLRRACRV